MASKTLGIAFATPLIGESHAACGSGENEVYALGNTINDILEFYYIQEEMGRKITMPCKLWTDAATAKVFAMGTALKTRLRHVDQRQGWVRACRDSRIATVESVPGDQNPADLGTKIYFKRPGQYEQLVA